MESTFNPEFDSMRFQNWQKKYELSILQILCHTERTVLFERFKTRALSPTRHPGHCETVNMEEFKESILNGRSELLTLPGEIISLDTTDFSTVNFLQVIQQVKDLIQPPHE